MGTDSRSGKLIARRVVRLPTGTVSFESISEERLLGKVDCEPRIMASGDHEGAKGSRVGGSAGEGRVMASLWLVG